MHKPLKVGLTGGIGSGKSTVCKIFRELSVPVIDADEIVHNLLTENSPAYQDIVQHFGRDVFMENGEIDRNRLRELIFNDTSKKNILENILHPLVYSEIDKQVLQLDSRYCIISVPLLIETNAMNRFDRILVIDTEDDLRLQRAASRDNCTLELVRKIDAQQTSREHRMALADDTIQNNNDIGTLRDQVIKLDGYYNDLSMNRL